MPSPPSAAAASACAAKSSCSKGVPRLLPRKILGVPSLAPWENRCAIVLGVPSNLAGIRTSAKNIISAWLVENKGDPKEQTNRNGEMVKSQLQLCKGFLVPCEDVRFCWLNQDILKRRLDLWFHMDGTPWESLLGVLAGTSRPGGLLLNLTIIAIIIIRIICMIYMYILTKAKGKGQEPAVFPRPPFAPPGTPRNSAWSPGASAAARPLRRHGAAGRWPPRPVGGRR